MDYDTAGGADEETLSYDALGNRITYSDKRNSVSTNYVHDVANQISLIDGASVTYDAAGNLSLDNEDYVYSYDHENRLTKVEYDGQGGLTQVGQFAYDALGRMISSQVRYDAAAADSSTLKFYYDGSNVLAEYDESDNLERRHVHGRTYIDERAIVLEGEGDDLDPYYYALQELDTVTGLVKDNGTLAEAYVYDAYGKVSLWGYRDFDMDRDGDVDSGDTALVSWAYSGSGNPTIDPKADYDLDGDVDNDDLLALSQALTGSGTPPASLRVSGLGNPYFFTGRRLQLLEDVGEEGVNPNRQLQYNRARHYHPMQGRWLQRDPIGYVDGMNLYEYVGNRPGSAGDPTGWSTKTKGCCGLDITEHLKKLMNQVDRSYWVENRQDRQELCQYGIWSLTEGWDITETLTGKRHVFSKSKCGKGDCVGTVTVNGRCFRADDVNYALWGKIHRLCNTDGFLMRESVFYTFTEAEAVEKVAFYRAFKGVLEGLDFRIAQRTAWTRSGYRGIIGAARGVSEAGCRACSTKYEGDLSWHLARPGTDGAISGAVGPDSRY